MSFNDYIREIEEALACGDLDKAAELFLDAAQKASDQGLIIRTLDGQVERIKWECKNRGVKRSPREVLEVSLLVALFIEHTGDALARIWGLPDDSTPLPPTKKAQKYLSLLIRYGWLCVRAGTLTGTQMFATLNDALKMMVQVGSYHCAEVACSEALKLAREERQIPLIEVAATFNNHAATQVKLGRLKQAKESYEMAMSLLSNIQGTGRDLLSRVRDNFLGLGLEGDDPDFLFLQTQNGPSH